MNEAGYGDVYCSAITGTYEVISGHVITGKYPGTDMPSILIKTDAGTQIQMPLDRVFKIVFPEESDDE